MPATRAPAACRTASQTSAAAGGEAAVVEMGGDHDDVGAARLEQRGLRLEAGSGEAALRLAGDSDDARAKPTARRHGVGEAADGLEVVVDGVEPAETGGGEREDRHFEIRRSGAGRRLAADVPGRLSVHRSPLWGPLPEVSCEMSGEDRFRPLRTLPRRSSRPKAGSAPVKGAGREPQMGDAGWSAGAFWFSPEPAWSPRPAAPPRKPRRRQA